MILPAPNYYDCIDRNAILVKPLKPLFDWLNALYPTEPPITGKVEGTIYLLKEHDTNEEIEDWLSKNYEFIFKNELNEWHTDPAAWPPHRSIQLFKQWFTYEIHSMVLDIEEEDITKY